MENIFYRQMMEESPIGYAYQKIICDAEGTPYDYEYIEVNASYELLTGMKASDIIGKKATEVLPFITEQEIRLIECFADVALNGGRKAFDHFSEHTNHWHKIDVYSMEKFFFVTFVTDTGRQYTTGEETNATINYQDHLTKLQEELERLDDEKYVPLTLMMVDVNGLKLSIDAFGPAAGEAILTRVETILKRECRAEDVVSRIESDEFILLLTKADAVHAEKIVSRINLAIAKEKINNLVLSVSIGFAVKQSQKDDLNDVFNRAEDEMYRHSIYEGAKMKRRAIDVILDTLFERSRREMMHSRNVSSYSVGIATRLGFSEQEIKQIRLTGLMHDIGKIGIDASILNKDHDLENDDWKKIKQHPEIGYKILNSVSELSEISSIVLEHHEKWDGSGYPKRLKGDQISVQARIISVADAYAAMTSDRPFMKTLTALEATNEIKRCAGTQFDPHIADIFIKMIQEENNL